MNGVAWHRSLVRPSPKRSRSFDPMQAARRAILRAQ
jgi:hypothetical protein